MGGLVSHSLCLLACESSAENVPECAQLLSSWCHLQKSSSATMRGGKTSPMFRDCACSSKFNEHGTRTSNRSKWVSHSSRIIEAWMFLFVSLDSVGAVGITWLFISCHSEITLSLPSICTFPLPRPAPSLLFETSVKLVVASFVHK